MSDEYPNPTLETSDSRRYSGFWPLLILLVALVLWSGFQAAQAYRQSSTLNNEFQSALPTIKAAQDAQTKLYALAQDLVQTGAKDPIAEQIVKEANIQIRQAPGAASNALSPTAIEPTK